MEVGNNQRPYSDEELKAALASLLLPGADAAHVDAQHLFGYGIADHPLSKLQRITAMRILDYESYLASVGDNVTTPLSPPSVETLLLQAKQMADQFGPILNLQTVIQQQAPRMALAAEFKRASPSKGMIAADHIQADLQGQTYAQAGANIISVLTESRHFLGSLQDLTDIRIATSSSSPSNTFTRPTILRKDFVINEYMIAEAAAAGADTILLIVAVLPGSTLQRFIQYARSLGMEPLVEVHADVELQVAIQAGAKVIGVNNRNLHTFQLDLTTSERMATQLRQQNLLFDPRTTTTTTTTNAVLPNYTLCALSGMSTADDVHRYRQSGVAMCLIGESLMRAIDPVQMIVDLCLHPDDYEKAKITMQQQNLLASNGGNDSNPILLGVKEDLMSLTFSSSPTIIQPYSAGLQLIKICGITRPEDALVACQAGAHLIGIIFVPHSPRCVTIQQAQSIVQVVREFGERCERITILAAPPTTTTAPTIPPSINIGTEAHPIATVVQSTQILTQIAHRQPLVVGVFQNQSSTEIAIMVQSTGIDLVQLHGSEGMKAAHRNQCGGIPALRVVDIVTAKTDTSTEEPNNDDDDDICPDAAQHILDQVTSDPIGILLDTAIKGNNSAGGGTGITFDWSIASAVQQGGLPVLVAGGLSPETVADCVITIRPYGVDVSSGVEISPGIKDHDRIRAFVQNARNAVKQ